MMTKRSHARQSIVKALVSDAGVLVHAYVEG